MKKFILAFFLVIGLILGLSTADLSDVKAGSPGFDFTYNINYEGATNSTGTVTNLVYGEEVTIDSGSIGQTGFEFVGFVVNGKVNPGIEASIRITETTTATAYFKPENTTAVIFMDTNQDYIDILYTNSETNLLDPLEVPDYSVYSKPGLSASDWNVSTSQQFTVDTLVYPTYTNSLVDALTLDVTNGDILVDTAPFSFNQTVTVSANGTGTFNYWLKDGLIASLDEEYTFTMASNHTLEAVYDSGFTADSNIFVTGNAFEIDSKATILGQFDLPAGEVLVEWGVLLSDMPGGITFDTPGVEVRYSNKYNPNTHEFVLVFNNTLDNLPFFRTFIKTVDASNNPTTTYSYVHKDGFAENLFISEYIEGSSNNKAIEIFNGTSGSVDLSGYSIETYSGTNTTANYIEVLDGTLLPGEVYVIYNSLADSTIKSEGDISSSVTFYNGDDAVALLKNGTVIDVLGEIGSGNTFGEEVTLVRKATIIDPNSIYDSEEWNSYSQDTFTYLGSHEAIFPLVPVQSSELTSGIVITGSDSVNVGETIQLTATYPMGGLEGVVWTVSDNSLATIDQTGLVTGVAEGEVLIQAYSFFSHDIVAAYGVNVLPVQTYDVTFNYNDGSTTATVETVNGGEAVTEPADPTRTGFVFDGWFDNVGLTGESYDFATPVTADINLYAKWIEEFTVTFNYKDSSTSPLEVTVNDGNLVTAPTDPTRTGFVFSGWFRDDETFEVEFDFETETITADIPLYAYWVDEAEAPVYSTSFESPDFTGSTTYNNTTEKYWGPESYQWVTFYGTPSTTSAIEGLQSMQSRYYSSAPTNYGYIRTDFEVVNISKVTSVKNASGANVEVTYSLDGGTTWIGAETFILSTSPAYYTYTINATGNVLIKFSLVGTTTNGARLYIDEVDIYNTPE